MVANDKNQALIAEIKRSCKVQIPLCDEYELMVSGMIFKTGNDVALQEHKISVLRHLSHFNDDSVPEGSTLQSLRERRMGIAEQIFGSLGHDVNVTSPFFVIWGCNTFIGDGTYMNRNVEIHDDAPVFIGKNVRIAMDVCICTGTHQLEPHLRAETGGSFALPIRIEDDCWIGARATILPGVVIGRCSTVCAGAVVSKSVEPYSVVGGVPARLIKKLEEKN